MEQRWSVRKATSMPVMIYVHGSPMAACRARNVGLEGIYLEVSSPMFSPESILEVEFTLPDGEEHRLYRLPGVVKHVTDGGVGVMFLSFHAKVFRILHTVLYECRSLGGAIATG
jgi:hypothetical protein